VLESYQEIPGSLKLLETVAQRSDTYLLSNTRKEWFEFVDAKFRLSPRVRQVFLSYEMRLAKPDPRCFHFAISKIGCLPSEAVFIDDRLENVLAAGELGMNWILFDNARRVRNELKELYPELFPVSCAS